MKQTKLQMCLLGALISGATAISLSYAQDNNEQTAPSEVQNSQWKNLTDQIIQLSGNQSREARNLTDAQLDTLKKIQILVQQLDELPDEDRVNASRYTITQSTNQELRDSNLANILILQPTAANVKFVLPYFDKFTDKQKNEFLQSLIFDAVLLRPTVPEFRQFPDSILKQAAQGIKLSNDLVSEAAVIVANYTTADEKQWMHQALTHYPESSGLWNTLTQLSALTPAEVQKARQMFVTKQSQSGWKLTLAAALSPYDPAMRALLRQEVATQIRTHSKGENLPQQLMILRIWETKQALPYLLQMLNSSNKEMKLASVPLLALRAPQELLRIGQLPNAKKRIPNLGSGLALAALAYPRFKSQATQIMIKIQGLTLYPDDDPQELADETFGTNVEMLQTSGMKIFSTDLEMFSIDESS